MAADTKRFQIANLAMSQVMSGAHYLKGARGGIPGGAAAVGRTVKLKEDPEWNTLRVHTGSNSLQTCFGRWKTVKGFLFQVGSGELKDLKTYVETNKSKPMESWPYVTNPSYAAAQLYPRRLNGPGSAIAAGEDCRGKRHFDCIGFIYWVLYEVAPSVSWENHGIAGYSNGFGEVEKLGKLGSADLKYGDIVTRTDTTPQHIGFVSFGNKVVHASMEAIGVIMEGYDKNAWTRVSRVKDEFL
jgi:hypothetical protein